MAYLYSLTHGHVARSFAHAAARSAGLNEKIIKRALEVIIYTLEKESACNKLEFWMKMEIKIF